jgi:glycosyltransferase involved in cell wall biosynthesis
MAMQTAKGRKTKTGEEAGIEVSVVIPVYNEQDNILLLHQKLTESLQSHKYELVYVDDGSRDASLDRLHEIVEQDPEHSLIIELRRNFGQTAAIAAGIDHSEGSVIVLIDADLQNDPADIPRLLEKINEGYDLVSGWRKERKDPWLTRRLPSQMANWLISVVTGVRLHDYGCTLKAYRREVLAGFRLYGEMHRFIPAYAGWVGAKISEMPVKHHPRRHGRTNYGLERTLKVLLDLLTVKFLISFSNKPIYLFGGAGFLMILPSAAILAFLLVRRLWLGTSVLASPLFGTSLMFMILGFQSILMGLIAELLVRTYHESQEKPTYTIRNITAGRDGGS